MLQQVLGGVVMGSIYALIALGYNIIFSTSGVLNFAQGEFVMLGALFLLSFLVSLKIPLIGALLLVMIIVGVIAMIVNSAAVAPLGHGDHSVIGWLMTTLGVSIILRNLAMLGWGDETLAVPHFSGSSGLIDFFGAKLLPQELWIIASAVVLTIGMEIFYRRTLFGKAVRATAFNGEITKLMGINPQRIVMFCWFISGSFAALAGTLISPIIFASAEMGGLLGLKGFAAAILGGFGNNKGALYGGLALGLIEALAVGLKVVTPGLKDAVAFLVLIAILMLRPGGITGAVLEKRV